MERNIEHNLVIVDESTGLPTFNPEAKTIKEFKDLITGSRKKGMNGEAGRRKATARMAAVFACSSYKSWFYSKLDFEGRIEAVASGKEIADFQREDIDQAFYDACEKFKELEQTPSIEALNELMYSLRLSLKFIKAIRKETERALENENLSTTDKDLVLHNIEKQISLATNIPKHIENLEETLKTIKKESEIKSYGKSKLSRNPRK